MHELTSRKFRFFSFLSMILLVYVHGYNLNDAYLQPFTLVHEPFTFTTFFEYLTANGLFRFRIPLLFVISGYLFALHDEQPHKTRIKKRVRTLVIPYLFWSAFALLITFIGQQFPVTAKAIYNAQIDQLGDNRLYTEIGWGGLLKRWTLTPVAFQLWFIRVLFVYNVLYPWLKKAVLNAPVLSFSIGVFLWISMMGLHFLEGEGLLFFSLGIWLCKNNYDPEHIPRRLNLKWVAPTFFTGAALKTCLAFYLPPVFGSYLLLLLLHKTVVFTGLVTCWYGLNTIVQYLMQRRWFAELTAFSFIIYALHVPLVNYLHHLLKPFLDHLPYYRLLDYCLLPSITIVLCIVTGMSLRKGLPRLYGFATGGRGVVPIKNL